MDTKIKPTKNNIKAVMHALESPTKQPLFNLFDTADDHAVYEEYLHVLFEEKGFKWVYEISEQNECPINPLFVFEVGIINKKIATDTLMKYNYPKHTTAYDRGNLLKKAVRAKRTPLIKNILEDEVELPSYEAVIGTVVRHFNKEDQKNIIRLLLTNKKKTGGGLSLTNINNEELTLNPDVAKIILQNVRVTSPFVLANFIRCQPKQCISIICNTFEIDNANHWADSLYNALLTDEVTPHKLYTLIEKSGYYPIEYHDEIKNKLTSLDGIDEGSFLSAVTV